MGQRVADLEVYQVQADEGPASTRSTRAWRSKGPPRKRIVARSIDIPSTFDALLGLAGTEHVALGKAATWTMERACLGTPA
jgi:hypothetical protein